MTWPVPLAPLTWTLGEHPEGESGVWKTASLIRNAAEAGSRDFHVWRIARSLLEDAIPYGQLDELERLFEFVRDRVRYTRDPYGTETLQTPQFTLQMGHGDCDDKVTLLGALLLSVGYPVRYVLAAADPADPARLSHVYLEALSGHGWVPMDAAVPWATLGWAPPATRREYFG